MDNTDRYNGQMSPTGDSARQCGFCQRQVSEDFLFCPFCGRRLNAPGASKGMWYHSKYAVAIGLATLGPFALPMVWSNPRYGVLTKVLITVLTLAATALLIYALVIMCRYVAGLVRQLTNMY